jgi:ABC-type thiamin/hydroxymethylpyrimidine transport system permease subunit
MKFSTRELVTIAVFGTLWGIVEMSLGTVLKSLNVPLSGVVLSTISLVIAMVGRVFVPRRGSTLFIGVVACLLKLFSLGGVIVGPMVGILSEAIIAEVALSALGRPRRAAFLVTGVAGVLCPLVQPFITNPLLFGRTLFTVWLDLLDLGSRLFGLDSGAVLWIVLGLVAVHAAIGLAAGWLAWDVGRVLQARLGPAPVAQLHTSKERP